MEVAERKRSFHEKINKIDKSESAAGSASSKQTKIHKTVVPKVVHSKRGIPSNSSSGIQSHTRSIRNKTRKSVKWYITNTTMHAHMIYIIWLSATTLGRWLGKIPLPINYNLKNNRPSVPNLGCPPGTLEVLLKEAQF